MKFIARPRIVFFIQYNDDYFEGLAAQYGDLFRNKQEAQDFVFFNYLDEVDWGKRVLAKLTHDIVEEAIG